MRRLTKSVVAALAGATIAGGAAAPVADAAPRSGSSTPLAAFAPYGNEFFTYGNNANCRGSVRMSVSAPKNKRGFVRLTLTSRGFTGDGAAWRRKPACDLLFMATEISMTAYNQENWIGGRLGRRGDTISKDIFTGSGYAQLSVWTMKRGNVIRTPQSLGVGIAMIVP